jgi:hypothetical protein
MYIVIQSLVLSLIASQWFLFYSGYCEKNMMLIRKYRFLIRYFLLSFFRNRRRRTSDKMSTTRLVPPTVSTTMTSDLNLNLNWMYSIDRRHSAQAQAVVFFSPIQMACTSVFGAFAVEELDPRHVFYKWCGVRRRIFVEERHQTRARRRCLFC